VVAETRQPPALKASDISALVDAGQAVLFDWKFIIDFRGVAEAVAA